MPKYQVISFRSVSVEHHPIDAPDPVTAVRDTVQQDENVIVEHLHSHMKDGTAIHPQGEVTWAIVIEEDGKSFEVVKTDGEYVLGVEDED